MCKNLLMRFVLSVLMFYSISLNADESAYLSLPQGFVEGLAYALRLFREGVPVKIKRFNSIHGFYSFQELDASKEAIANISLYLSELFSKRLNQMQPQITIKE